MPPALPPVPAPGPHERVRVLHDAPPAAAGRYVLYWMTAQRRTRANEALARAVAWARHLDLPVLVFEALGLGYEHASARLHAFVLEGMQDNEAACAEAGVRYLSYVEPTPRAGRGLLAALAAHAAVVVTDDHPVHPFPKLIERARAQVSCRFECVDACGIFPMRVASQTFPTAYAFRRYLQKNLPARLDERPALEPLRAIIGQAPAVVPRDVLDRWPALRLSPGRVRSEILPTLPIDQDVAPVALVGGARAAGTRLRAFLEEDLDAYAEERNHPDANRASGLSPYLHFGHIGAAEVFEAVCRREGWEPTDVDTVARGTRAGWWGMSPSAEAFLDQLITWRELGFHTCVRMPDTYASLESLPAFAQETLAVHTADPRPHLYTRGQLERAETADPIWNAAQRELVREGTMQNYLRMNWGKRVLEWSATPEDALARLIYLNDKYALDGRDPNSYSGILWCFGRHDRAWGPERPIFGKVRYMTSARTEKKLQMSDYLARFGPSQGVLPWGEDA